MNKIKTLVRAPVLTSSGYGIHSRQIIFALLNDSKYDLYVESVPWGGCAYLTENTPQTKVLKQYTRRYEIAKHQGQDKDFDLFISITIPQEFERRGKINIGVTAAAETDRCSANWLQKCNEMDHIVVPSRHAQQNLASTVLDWTNQQTNESGQLRLQRPISVSPEGFDAQFFRPNAELKTRIKKLKFSTDFNFLLVGQWANGGYGEDRKNIANSILYFLKAFQGRKDVGLILKVNLGRNSAIDAEMVTQRIKAIKSNFPEDKCPPIHLLHDTLTDAEMGELYNHPQVKCLLSLTHGEGFGLPILEAAASGLPIIATNWSGHLDFLQVPKSNQRFFSSVAYDLKTIPQASVWDPVLVAESKWAVPREDDAIHRMRKMVDSYATPRQWAGDLSSHVRNHFTLDKVQKAFLRSLDQVIKSLQAQNGNPETLTEFIDDPEAFNVLYTMPMSSGDVFISTAVIDGVMKSVRKEHEKVHVYVATMPQYAPILKDNPNVHKVIDWQQSMMDIAALEEVFDLVLTPNVATQFVFSNWVRAGQGRNLAEEMANHCQVELGDFFIAEDDSIFTTVMVENDGNIDLRSTPFVTVHPGSGKGQWEARKYVEWPEVVKNLKNCHPDCVLVQIGSSDEPMLQCDVDLRGKTTVHQLASVLKSAKAHVSIDTFSMHLAAAFKTPLVALFGSSHAASTGPWYRNPEKEKFVLLEAQNKMGCAKACYKYQCKVNKELPCVNEIDSQEVVRCVSRLLEHSQIKPKEVEYQRVFGRISGYTTSFNAVTMGYPFIESITSMLGFCDEIIVVDHSTDGTYDILEKMAKDDSRIQLYQNEWDLNNPTMDGDSKAYARALCQYEFCWQQDLDEVVHERDYDKIKWITKRFPSQADILHLPVIECWGDEKHATGRRHSWKWRLSRNNPNITHGVNKHARLTDEKTGQVYAREGMSDSCEYVDIVTFDMLPHVGFYNEQWEQIRQQNPEQWGALMNGLIEKIPSVYHYSWFNLHKKIEQFAVNWNRQWNVLYQKQLPPRFEEGQKKEVIVQKLYDAGGEENDPVKYKWELKASHPSIMRDWIDENSDQLKATG